MHSRHTTTKTHIEVYSISDLQFMQRQGKFITHHDKQRIIKDANERRRLKKK